MSTEPAAIDEPTPENPGPEALEGSKFETTAETLGHDMLQALVDELKAAPDCWQKMSQLQQESTIRRLEMRTRRIIEEGLRTILSGEFPACVAMLDRVNFSGGIKAQLSVTKGAHSRHELADAVGTPVIVIIGDPDQYRARMAEVKAAAEQGDLFGAGGPSDRIYNGEQDRPKYRSDETLPKPEKSWADLTGPDDAEDPAKLVEALNFLGVYPDTYPTTWTAAERRVAAEWIADQAAGGNMARPHWLPLPQELETGGAEPSHGTLEFGGAVGSLPQDDDTTEHKEPEHANA